MEKKFRQKKEIAVTAYCFAVSLLFLLFFSKNSFFYPLNNGADINMFYTMGKAIAEGLVCYRDVFDQKGPIWYFLYAVAYLLDKNGYFGIFIIEAVSFTAFLFFTYKILDLYEKERYIFAAAPFLAFLTMGNGSFWQGGQVEELIFPLLGYLIYSLLRFFKEDYPEKPMPYITLFLNGVCSGLVFWSKFTLIMPWFIFMAGLFFILLSKKHIKEAFLSCLAFLAGTMAPTLAVAVYFVMTNAVGDLVKVYFIDNLFGYSEGGATKAETLLTFMGAVSRGFDRTAAAMVTALFGYIYFAVKKDKFLPGIGAKLIFPVMFVFSLFGIFGGGHSYMYYAGALIPFALLGVVALSDIIEALFEGAEGKFNKKKGLALISAVTLVLCFSFSFSGNKNLPTIFEKKEDTPQYRFAGIINSVPDSTMINYGFLDHGFYYAADKMPPTKYFARINLKYEALPEMYRDQLKAVQVDKTDFVVLALPRGYSSEDIPKIYGKLFSHYKKADEIYHYNGDSKGASTYVLLAHESVDLDKDVNR